jgi:integrase
MAVKWIKTKYPNVRYREHPIRKTRNGQPDKYFTVRTFIQGISKEEGLGWASEGWTADKAYEILGNIKKGVRLGNGPASIADMRREGEARRKAEEALRIREEATQMTLGNFFETIYIPKVKKEKRSWGDDERRIKKHILPELGEMPLCAITTEHVQTFLDRASETSAPASVRHLMAILRRAFNIASQSSINGVPLFVSQNPAVSSRLNLPEVFNSRERFLTKEEAAALIKLAKEKAQVRRGTDPFGLHDAIIISLYAGLRISEIMRLQWIDVDLSHGFVTVRKEEKRKPGGTVPLNEMSLKVLQRRYKEREGPLVFKKPCQRRENFSHAFRDLVDEIGLNAAADDTKYKVVFHSLRHTFASWLALGGTDIYRIKTLMRHKTIEMTMRYAHLIPDATREAVHRLPPV